MNLWNKDSPTTPMRCETEGNILDARLAVALFSQAPPGKILPRGEAEAALPQVFTWHGARNLYAIGGPFLRLTFPNEFAVPARPIRSVAEWGQFWGTAEAGSIEGRVRYQGGDLLARLGSAPGKLTAEDFRLRPDSAGYRADKDGKDLGADVDLVGPGPAYERWKKTPAYQQWLKDTGQLRAEAAKPKPKAFVLLGGKGIVERKFDTLAEAVQSPSGGDTIEVRGNGPFLTQPIAIKNRALTIRAGEGFRPVIKGDPDEQGNDLLSTKAPLVLEGLDFHWVGAKAFDPTAPNNTRLVVSNGPGSQLHVANCRYLMNRREGPNDGMNLITASDTALCRLRNCQFLFGGHGRLGGSFLAFRGVLHSELMVDNCLIVGHGVGLQLTHAEPMKAVLRRNTFLGSSSPIVSFTLGKKIDPPLGEKDPRPLQMEISASILDGYVRFSQFEDYLVKEKVISAKESMNHHLICLKARRGCRYSSSPRL